MAQTTVVPAGAVTLTRVLYLDAVVPSEAVGLDLDQARAVSWCDERWATDEGIVATAAAWVASSGDRHVVFDPFRNADDILHDPESAELHYAAITDAFAAAGIPVDAVTDVVLSHIEGLGMIVRRSGDHITPFFPNATLRLGQEAVDDFDASPRDDDWTNDIWRRLLDDAQVDRYHDGAEIAPGVIAEHTGAHNPGHYVFHFGGGPAADGPHATFVGHLAVSPLHLSTGPCEPQHDDPALAWNRLSEMAADGRVLIGPLWPSPGAGRLVANEFVAWSPTR